MNGTRFEQKSFTVPASGENKLPCAHGWVAKSRCVLCGEPVGYACDERQHRFEGESLTCACGTTTRRRIVGYTAYQINGLATR